MRILVVAAHPDDEVLGAGGAIARHARRGDRVTIAILGEGLSARYAGRASVATSRFARLKEQSRLAAAILGCRDIRFCDFPDNRFDSVDFLDIVKAVERITTELRPETVYTHFGDDLNVDHRLTAAATLTACRPLPGSQVRRILSFEVPSATGWSFPQPAFVPTVFVDIERTLATKLRALRAYASEMRPFPHARSLKSVEHRARAWGAQVGRKAAEAFALLREISA